jgi:LacI family transcriptional regulator
VGLRQVAERAGVSLATASNVFAGKQSVSAAMRAAVLAAAAELRYQPGRRSPQERVAVRMLGFIIRDNISISNTPFYSDVLYAAEQACARRDLTIARAHVPADASRLEELPPMMQHRHVQGLLVVGTFRPGFYTFLQRVGLPWVSVDYYDEALPTDCVTGQDIRDAYLATRHLLELGHRSPPPAMVVSPPGRMAGPYGPNFELRWRGYCRALAEAGIPYDEQYVPWAEVGTAIDSLWQLPIPPTAIFCCNDPTALFVLDVLRERGIRVPHDCSVVGYDDIFLASTASPPLTTVRVNRMMLAEQGVTHLLERISWPELPPRHTAIAGSLIPRHSTTVRQGGGADYTPPAVLPRLTFGLADR